tara:strand:+ start:449 stop:634 length:186 start_codon:yes stop_codon:yes gene_type:complete
MIIKIEDLEGNIIRLNLNRKRDLSIYNLLLKYQTYRKNKENNTSSYWTILNFSKNNIKKNG